jgi:hypothetical protein
MDRAMRAGIVLAGEFKGWMLCDERLDIEVTGVKMLRSELRGRHPGQRRH